MNIYFMNIRWKNLLSTGNVYTELKLNEYPSSLILGDNGAGKSTLLDALSYVLYGKAFRNINLPQLVNSINGKGLIVDVEFVTNNKNYIVRRGMKPSVFEIYENGVLLNQEAESKDYQKILEKNILRLNHKSFSQIITLGSTTFVPFMQMTSAARRAFIEDLLDIQIFSTMNTLLKEKVTDNKDAIQDCGQKIALAEQKIQLSKKHIAVMQQDNDDMIEIKRNKIIEHNQMIADLENKLEINLAGIETMQTELDGYGLKKLLTEAKKIDTLKNKLKFKKESIAKDIKFFSDNDNCPTCSQEIDSEHKHEKVESFEKKSLEVVAAIAQLTATENEINKKIGVTTKLQTKIDALKVENRDYKNKITMYNSYIEDIEREIESLSSKKERAENDSIDLSAAREELEKLEKEREELTNNKSLLNTAALLLKDGGIKTKIIKQYVPVINKLINKYLAALDFFCEFQIDENFDEKIKSRFRDEFSYASFSEGEKLRIDIALLLTWRAVSKLRNSSSTNLLVMDEIADSSLDGAGTDEFFKLLSTFSDDTNMFIISHKGDVLVDKFANIIRFEKVGNFSSISS